MENVHRGSDEGVGFYRSCHGDGGRLFEVAVARSFANDEQAIRIGFVCFLVLFFLLPPLALGFLQSDLQLGQGLRRRACGNTGVLSESLNKMI